MVENGQKPFPERLADGRPPLENKTESDGTTDYNRWTLQIRD